MEQISKAGLLRRLLPFPVGSAYNVCGKIYVRFDDVQIVTKDGIPVGVKSNDVTVFGGDISIPGTNEIPLDTIMSDPTHPLYHFSLLGTKQPVITTRLQKTLPTGKKDYTWYGRIASILFFKLGVGPLPKWAGQDADSQSAFDEIMKNLGDMKWLTA